MPALALSPSIGLVFNLEFYHGLPARSEAKVGTVEIRSRSFAINDAVATRLASWLTANGWAGLVRIESEVDRRHATSYGFNEAQVSFVPGEFQSNGRRVFHAEVPFDLPDLGEELVDWLTRVGGTPAGERPAEPG